MNLKEQGAGGNTKKWRKEREGKKWSNYDQKYKKYIIKKDLREFKCKNHNSLSSVFLVIPMKGWLRYIITLKKIALNTSCYVATLLDCWHNKRKKTNFYSSFIFIFILLTSPPSNGFLHENLYMYNTAFGSPLTELPNTFLLLLMVLNTKRIYWIYYYKIIHLYLDLEFISSVLYEMISVLNESSSSLIKDIGA